MLPGSLLSCPALRASPSFVSTHLLVLGIAVCAALYMYYLFSEMRRLDVRLSTVSNQLAASLRSTQQQLEQVAADAAASQSIVGIAGIAGSSGLLINIFNGLTG